jgi:hypothetical protein
MIHGSPPSPRGRNPEDEKIVSQKRESFSLFPSAPRSPAKYVLEEE